MGKFRSNGKYIIAFLQSNKAEFIVQSQDTAFYFSKSDVMTVKPVVKHMNLVDMADGMATYLESLSEQDPSYKCRLLSGSLEKLQVYPSLALHLLITTSTTECSTQHVS